MNTQAKVHGLICSPDASPQVGRIVQVFDVDLRTAKVLGQVTTDLSGRYEFQYDVRQLSRPEKQKADIRVKIIDANNTTIATSSVLFSAPVDATIDVVVGGAVLIGLPEYRILLDAIKPVLAAVNPPLNPADITVNADLDDVSFIVGQTGVDRENLLLLVTAHQGAKKVPLEADVLYGLFRTDLPDTLPLLFSQSPDKIKEGLAQAIAHNFIRPRTTQESDAIVATFKTTAIAANSGGADAPIPAAPLIKVLKLTTALPSLNPVLDTFSTHDGTAQQFWDKLRNLPATQPHVETLQRSVQFGALTMNHAGLVQELQRRVTAGEIASFTDLAKYKRKNWLDMLNLPAVGQIPGGLPGATVDEQKLLFATVVQNIVEDALPHQFFIRRLADDDDDAAFTPLVGKIHIQSFFRQNPNFDLSKTRFTQFLSANPTALDGIQDKKRTIELGTAIQRLHSIAPRYAHIRTLLADGITSSLQIARMGRSTFMIKYKSKFGGSGIALDIINKAEYTHAAAFSMATYFSNPGLSSKVPVLLQTHNILNRPEALKNIPDWATLFENPDTGAYDEFRSMDSPAAYLVDMLHFLKDRRVIKKITRDPPSVGHVIAVEWEQKIDENTGLSIDKPVLDALFQRRPDLAILELTGTNTKLPLPYIDLAIEILENAIAPPVAFTPFNLPLEAGTSLNSGRLDPLRSRFTPQLSPTATLDVESTGKRWSVNDTAFTYRIEMIPSPTPTISSPSFRVVSRSLQTTGTSVERAASPQYTNSAAYEVLAGKVWPWNLPFDVTWETVRVYLAHLNVERARLMEALSRNDFITTIARPDIAKEHIGLNSVEADLITANSPAPIERPTFDAFALYGFSAATLSVNNSVQDPTNNQASITEGSWNNVITGRVDIFLQRCGIEYPDLLNLLEIGSLFTGGPLASIVAIGNNAADTVQLNQLQIAGWTNDSVLQRIQGFIRLWKKLPEWSIIGLGKAAKSLQRAATPTIISLSEQFLVQLSHIQLLRTSLDLELEVVLAMWSDIETAVLTEHDGTNIATPDGSFYEKVFCNLLVLRERSLIFTRDPATLTGTITAQGASVAASLKISGRDLGILIQERTIVDADQLTLTNLSKLFRHTSMATALSLSIPDYVILLKLVGTSPFSSTIATYDFVKRAQRLLDSGFNLTELNWLLRHEFKGDEVNPTDESLARTLQDLRENIRTIVMENTFQYGQQDDKGVLTKTKLSQLNWPAEVINRAIDMFAGTATFDTHLAAFPVATADIDVAVRYRINFDPQAQKLNYIGPMSGRERELLTRTTGMDQPSKDAVAVLFQAPGAFFARHFQRFTLQSFQTPLPEMPAMLKIPTSLRNKVFFDQTSNALVSSSALTESERDILFQAANGITNAAAYSQAVLTLYNMAANPPPPEAKDKFIDAADVSRLFDDVIPAEKLTPSQRFIYILQILLPKLRSLLSKQAVTRALSEATGLHVQETEDLLKNLSLGSSGSLMSILCDDNFIQAGANAIVTNTLFPSQFSAVLLLQKAAMIVSRFRLTSIQLNWLFQFRRQTTDPATGWLDLNKLPLTSPVVAPIGTIIPLPNFIAWERLRNLVELRNKIPDGISVLNIIFTMSRKPGVTAGDVMKYFASRTKWPQTELEYIRTNVFGFGETKSFQDEVALSRILEALIMIDKLGCSSANALLLAAPKLQPSAAQLAIQAAKSKYDQNTWQMSIAMPIRNILREKQRAALVSCLLVSPPDPNLRGWRNSNDLFAHYLIDVEMGPCQMTSRIKQAICSVQLFVQRCRMGLEKLRSGIEVSEEVDEKWSEWDWMKYQNVHGANYRIRM
jgi:hypothetical protein